MGKIGGAGSWLTAVKRAFRSPSKREEHEQEEEEKVRFCLVSWKIVDQMSSRLVGVNCNGICFWVCAEAGKTKMDFSETFQQQRDRRTTL